MKIDTEDLRKSASDLSGSLKGYFGDVERIQDEFDKLSSAINEATDEILDDDESYMMSILYGEDIEKMRMNIKNATYYLEQVWNDADNLRIKIKRNDEVLGDD
jgi:predicted  nucleic acid-binding Zn-ribbon protein